METKVGSSTDDGGSNNEKAKADKFNGPVLFVALLLFSGTLLIYVLNFGVSLSEKHQIWAEFGDFFGGFLSAIFGLAALIALLYTIRLQSTALDISSEELRLTRGEIKNSTNALISQNHSMVDQRIDNTFFQLLNTHSEIVNAIELDLKLIQKASGLVKGRACFKYYLESLEKEYFDYVVDFGNEDTDSKKTDKERINEAYLATFKEFQAELGHYFRFLYNIFKFIHRDVADEDQQKFYAKLVRSQLSNYELALLFYNCQSDLGSIKFELFVEQFALLKNLPTDLLLDSNHRDGLYDDKAWRSDL